jgi:hypothetical protein
MIMSVMRVEWEEPLSPDLKGLVSGCSRTFLQRARGAYGYVLPGGVPRGSAIRGPAVMTIAWDPRSPGSCVLRFAPKSSSV